VVQRGDARGGLGGLGPIRCYSRTFSSGPVGGWLTANESADGSAKVAVDWTPADWTSLTMAEAADLQLRRLSGGPWCGGRGQRPLRRPSLALALVEPLRTGTNKITAGGAASRDAWLPCFILASMPDQPAEELLLSVQERARFVPPPCAYCGAGQIPTWIESGHQGGRGERLFRLTHLYCPTRC
jgi:hypothetical protein